MNQKSNVYVLNMKGNVFFSKIIAYFLAEKTHRTGFDVVSISSCEILMLIYMYIQTVSLESS